MNFCHDGGSGGGYASDGGLEDGTILLAQAGLDPLNLEDYRFRLRKAQGVGKRGGRILGGLLVHP